MKVLVKISLSVYYILLFLILIIQVIASQANHDKSSFDPQILLIINIAFSSFLIYSGLQSLRTIHRKWINKKIILILLIAYISWVLGCLLIMWIIGLLDKDLISIFAIPMIPCLIHNFWYYFNFDKVTYDYKAIDDHSILTYEDIFQLRLPFLKIHKHDSKTLKLTLSTPFSLFQIFLFLFLTVWISGWTFGATMVFIDFPLLGIFLYAILIPVIYLFVLPQFAKIHVTIDNNEIVIKQVPILKQIRIKSSSELEQRVMHSGKGRVDFYFRHQKNGKKTAIGRFMNNEIIYVLAKILEVHESTKKVANKV